MAGVRRTEAGVCQPLPDVQSVRAHLRWACLCGTPDWHRVELRVPQSWHWVEGGLPLPGGLTGWVNEYPLVRSAAVGQALCSAWARPMRSLLPRG